MKVTYKLLLTALLAGFILSGCAEKDAAAPADGTMEEAQEMAQDAAEMADDAAEMAQEAVEEVSNEPGGYVPSDDELVPGETRP